MSVAILDALRRIRAIDATDPARLVVTLLELVASETSSWRVTLVGTSPSRRHEFVAAGTCASPPSGKPSASARTCLEITACSGDASLVFERADGFDDTDAVTVEILGGEVLLRLAQARAEDAAVHGARQIELLRALSHAASEVMQVSEVADRAATEILAAFRGAHVAVHVLVDGQLDLVARRIDTGGARLDSAPQWLRRMPLDGPMLQSVVAREKKITTRPVHELAAIGRAALEPIGVRHLLVAPLLSNERVVGVLSVAHRTESPWPAEGLRMLESATKQLGVALAQLTVLEEERRRASDLALINDLGALVAQHFELPSLLSTAVSQLARLADIPRVHVMLANAERTELVGFKCNQETLVEVSLPLTGSSAAGLAFRTMVPVIISDVANDPRASRQLAAELGSLSVMAVPLIAQGASIGVIVLAESRHAREFTKSDVARATAVANLLSPAIVNAKMFEDLRRSYQALARAQAELVTHERLAAVGQLSAVIAHEVRNPLAVIYNSLGSLRRLAPASSDATLLLDIVGEEAARLNRIVGDLLDFVKPYASHPRSSRLDVLLNKAVEGACRASPGVDVRVRIDLGAQSEEAVIDGAMLHQALVNLIVNAMQASPKGGTITVRASTVVGSNGPQLCCEVIDEGPGIDASDAMHIFEPFFTTKATGTGLGLAVVKRIADVLRGRIEVAPAPSGGSVFTLTVLLGDKQERGDAATSGKSFDPVT